MRALGSGEVDPRGHRSRGARLNQTLTGPAGLWVKRLMAFILINNIVKDLRFFGGGGVFR